MPEMCENEYLEMCNQLKEKFDDVERKEQEVKKILFYIRKDLMKIYGLSQSMDEYMLNGMDLPEDITTVLELLIACIRDTTEHHILGKGKIDCPNFLNHLDISHILTVANENVQPVRIELEVENLFPNQQN